MKKIHIIILSVLVACTIKDTPLLKDFQFIEDEIEIYRKYIIHKTIDYQSSNNKFEQNNINKNLYYKILEVYYESNYYINTLKTNSKDKVNYEPFLLFLDEKSCDNLYNQIDTNQVLDTLYIHNIKLKYIQCIIKNSRFYDSIPEIKLRIEGNVGKP